ncbi:Ketosteroid isomerase-related protein [Pseudomonas sp. NFACC15-1]|uniref:nuclear transport factor 2 family protein n=1 Tax=unclassified Pseudomonas TaxID=196821 RepID=UPI00088B3D09|nr:MULTISPECIES: nuclear transport factor 2 family protein [unclassified Pseudomonas]SDA50882.1 Ketosteroid isomerase-related protein [Pseudomonas sp. NFACC15-1]SDW83214.1 Ketosteroid isomerase-related protein [Pseudomonas sp. NFACC14]
MSQDENIANASTLRAFYDAIFTNDWAAVERVVAADLVVHEAEGLPYGGVYHGIDQLQSLFGQVVSYWDELKINVIAVTAGDSYAIGLLQFSGRSKARGVAVSMPVSEVTQFKDGRICSIRPIYWDTKLISEAVTA